MHKYSEEGPGAHGGDGEEDQIEVDVGAACLGVLLLCVFPDGGDGAADEENVGDGDTKFGIVAHADHQTDVDDWPASHSRRLYS